MGKALLLIVVGIASISSPLLAQDAETASKWTATLQSDIRTDLDAGKPLVIQAHVPLCDRNQIMCGNDRLGDGDNPKTNLYWSTSGGFVGWFGRRRSGWKQVLVSTGKKEKHLDDDILEVRVWKRRFKRRSGLAETAKSTARPGTFEVFVVAYAWRGSAIRKAMNAYRDDLYGSIADNLLVDKTTTIAAGGAARVISYVGHNGWMDVERYDFSRADGKQRPTAETKTRKGTIAIACITEDYLVPQVSSPLRVPLLFTRSLMFAGAHSFEGAVSALADGRNLAEIRKQAVRNYANGQGKTARQVGRVFTNPTDKRWKNLPRKR